MARYSDADLNVVALVGERGREVRPFLREALGQDGLARSVVVVALADETPLSRVRAGESAVAIAESFRDSGKKVMLIFDSLTRWAMAQRELGLMLGEPPTSRGYTPGVFQKLAVLLERLGNSSVGSITALLTVLVEGDDVNDPVADAARGVLDGHIILSRDLASQGHFPAIDVPASASRVFVDITSAEHQALARVARQIISRYRQTEDLLQVGAYQRGGIPQTDMAVDLYPALQKFLEQAIRTPSAMADSMKALKHLLAPWIAAGY
jgi:flagellum-specific ATP synthase